ncbi:MAG: DUF3618 domain-containing protein [Frankiaceae bacterium]|nr:DUF3618 domain-containing protein [Frankiaceae bacterium]MBV9871329.1 DUF3618 domain-containing protein [Frankiaceae bacterium]
MSRDPDRIAKEIEQTRAELASTIDAIADRISPRKAAARGAQAVRAKVGGEPAAATPAQYPSQPAVPVVPIAAAVGLVAVVVVFVRRRRSR